MIASLDHPLLDKLEAEIGKKTYKQVTSIAIYNHFEALYTRHFKGSKKKHLHNTRSVGKSFTSALVGMAIRDGYLSSVDQTLSEFYYLHSYEHYSDKKADVTIKSLMTMSSAFNGSDNDMDSPGNEEYMYPTKDWVKFALDLEMRDDRQIGEIWDYFTAGVIVLGDILDKAVPGGLARYAKSELFDPLQISRYKWPTTPTGVPITAGGLQLTTEGLAKYGLLYLNHGRMYDQQILPKDWVTETLTKHLSVPDRPEDYGYLFWNRSYQLDDGSSHDAWFAAGNGGSKILCFNDLGIVMIVTATAYGQKYMHQQVDEMIVNYLLPSLGVQ